MESGASAVRRREHKLPDLRYIEIKEAVYHRECLQDQSAGDGRKRTCGNSCPDAVKRWRFRSYGLSLAEPLRRATDIFASHLNRIRRNLLPHGCATVWQDTTGRAVAVLLAGRIFDKAGIISWEVCYSETKH